VSQPARRRTRPSIAVLFWRALRRRCPNCGAGGVFDGWFAMRRECAGCGLHFEREESGYAVGAYMLNIAVAELLLVGVGVAIGVATWPNPPWKALMYGGALLMAVLPVLFYPFAKTLFLAMDLAVRPHEGPKPGTADPPTN